MKLKKIKLHYKSHLSELYECYLSADAVTIRKMKYFLHSFNIKGGIFRVKY